MTFSPSAQAANLTPCRPATTSFWVYILSNRSHTLYIGMTNNLTRRLAEHRDQKPGTHTAKYAVTRLVHVEFFEYVRKAIARENAPLRPSTGTHFTMMSMLPLSLPKRDHDN